MKRFLLLSILCLLTVVVAACGKDKQNPYNIQVQPFTYVDQEGQALSLEDLKNKVWVADFIFTYCTTVCPTMTMNMANLQKKLKAAGVEAELVSFSVDPERDDPAALKSYLSKFDADFTNWHALTGYTFEEIKTFVLKSFKSTINKDSATDQVIHGTAFYLVDQSGTVVAKYDGMTDSTYDDIINDIKILTKQ
ncbi:SCO1 protein [Brevibacillus reuszeri]|uniref:SCO family protein n=1 Tax=Brevibacillus reuszeri TaxID=54915 RepID=UPI001B144835|nr:SCO family protein [Brevibacillus reuszeri]GIO06382.1 SCO1 protein [Brevibacillus reuszeri]